jgi:hypothetical protein
MWLKCPLWPTKIEIFPALTLYLLIPWWKVLFENLTGSQLVKKFPLFYGTRKFITTFITKSSLRNQDSHSSTLMHSIYIDRHYLRK